MPIRRLHAHPHPQNAPRQNAAQRLLSILDNTTVAQPRNTVVRADGELLTNQMASAVAGLADVLPLGAELADLVDTDGRIYLDPPGQAAGNSIPLDVAMSQSSRALGAGAYLAVLEQEPATLSTGRGAIMAKQTASFSTFEPVQFGVVDFVADPAAEVPLSPVPVSDTEIDRAAMVARAFSFDITRREMKAKTNRRLAAELLWPIVQGLGRAVDATLFEALSAQPANPWAPGKAAALGLPFSALKAIVGTTGTGAAPLEGALFVDGVPAELSGDMAETWVGAWSRAAVAVDSEIQLDAARLSADGAMRVTVWLSMQALVPNPDAFWEVA